MDWDDLPGDSANHISDIETEIDTLTDYLDRGDKSLDLADVEGYLSSMVDIAQLALQEIREAL